MKRLIKKYQYSDNLETKTFELRIGVSVDFWFHFTTDDIPQQILERVDNHWPKRQYFDSFYELNERVTDLIEKYEASFVEEVREKVICYFYKSREPHSVDGGHGLELAYRVLWRYQVGDEVRYLKERRHVGGGGVSMDPVSDPFSYSDLGRDVKAQEMPWTAEREQWFDAVCRRVEDLSRSIKDGIGKTRLLESSK